jgi:hypothetical protein
MSPNEKHVHSTVLLMALDRLQRNETSTRNGVAHKPVAYRGIIPNFMVC